MLICLDTNCVIYRIENNPFWGPKIVARLAATRTAGDKIAVCDLACSECLVGPLKNSDAALLANYSYRPDRATKEGGELFVSIDLESGQAQSAAEQDDRRDK